MRRLLEVVAFLSDHWVLIRMQRRSRLLPLGRGNEVNAASRWWRSSPNAPSAMAIAELGYTRYGDSYEDMKLYAKDHGFSFPYLYDGDTQVTAKAYGCLCTPEVYLFDRDRKLRYFGRFDDSRFAETNTVHSSDTRTALEEMLAGAKRWGPLPVTLWPGCSVP